MKVVAGVLVAVAALAAAGATYASPPPTSAGTPAATAAARASRWIITVKPGARGDTDRIVHRCGGKPSTVPEERRVGIYHATGSRAKDCIVKQLRRKHLLKKVERDTRARGQQALAPDPLDPLAGWRPLIVDPNLVAPPVTAYSPLLAIVDDPVDLRHPEFAGAAIGTLNALPLRSSHGIATAAIAGAPKNDVGIVGVWPGMRVLNIPLPSPEFACSDRVRAISAAIQAQAAVISLEYGSRDNCFAESVMVQLAISQRIIVVAGAGNSFAEGNAPEYPGFLPHVVTVGAVGADLRKAPFSTAHNAVDLSAPGVNILTAVRPGDAGDADGDGYAAVSGTSFSAAMVAAAAAWVRAARPEYGRSRVVNALLRSARRVESPRWTPGAGFGVLDVASALREEVNDSDPLEPNDDVEWVDGTIFRDPDETIGAGGHDDAFVAQVDRNEDPADVYRVVVPGHGHLRVSVRLAFGDLDLDAFAPGARSISDRRRRVGRSRRPPTRTERLVLRNRDDRARTFFLAVRARSLNSIYLLHLRRPGGRARAATLRSGPDLAEIQCALLAGERAGHARAGECPQSR